MRACQPLGAREQCRMVIMCIVPPQGTSRSRPEQMLRLLNGLLEKKGQGVRIPLPIFQVKSLKWKRTWAWPTKAETHTSNRGLMFSHARQGEQILGWLYACTYARPAPSLGSLGCLDPSSRSFGEVPLGGCPVSGRHGHGDNAMGIARYRQGYCVQPRLKDGREAQESSLNPDDYPVSYGCGGSKDRWLPTSRWRWHHVQQ
jgi:hypothetical protein